MAAQPALSHIPALRPQPGPRPRLLGPGWPLSVLLVGFPALWALGVGGFATQLVAVPMAVELFRRRDHLHVPRGFGIWLMFLVCSAVGVLLLGVNPPGTVPASAGSRLIGYAMRESTYVAVTIILLYVGNLSEGELPEKRVLKQLAFFFGTVTIGGILGLLWSNFSFVSPLEMLLPNGVTTVPFVHHLVHPAFAQVQELGDVAVPRPSAPFAYTNTWGFQISLLAIWAFIAWIVNGTSRTRWLGAVVFATAVLAVFLSVNRGVWLGVTISVLYLAIAMFRRGHLVPLTALALIAVVGLGLFLNTPLEQVYQHRMENGKSDDIRAFTTERALELSTQSPVVGFGSTRSALGSAKSIAIGNSPDCMNCGNIPIGINGSVYTLLVTTGWTGLLLFYGFLFHQAWLNIRDRSAVASATLLTIALSFVYGFFYTVELTVPFIAIALMWRRRLCRRRDTG